MKTAVRLLITAAVGFTALIACAPKTVEVPVTSIVRETVPVTVEVTRIVTATIGQTSILIASPVAIVTVGPTDSQMATPVVAVPSTPSADFTTIATFQGHGKGTTDLFSVPDGLLRIKWDYVGEYNFILYLNRLDTDYSALIENTIGNAHGQSIQKVVASDVYLVDVGAAVGNWTIVIEFRPLK